MSDVAEARLAALRADAEEQRQEGRAEIIEKLKPLLRYPTPAIRKALKKIIEGV